MDYEKLYEDNIGTVVFGKANREEAFEKVLEAANGGYIKAIVSAGREYRDGDVVPKNSAEALKWFTLAAEQGDTSGIACLDDVYMDLYGADWEDYYVPVMERYVAMGYQEAAKQLAEARGLGLIGNKRKEEYEKRLKDIDDANLKARICTIIALVGFMSFWVASASGIMSFWGVVLPAVIVITFAYSAGRSRKYIHHAKFKWHDTCTKYEVGGNVNADHYWFPTSKDRRAYIKALKDKASKARPARNEVK